MNNGWQDAPQKSWLRTRYRLAHGRLSTPVRRARVCACTMRAEWIVPEKQP